MPARTERVEFAGSQGHSLAGRLEVPAGRPAGYALFAHCFTCGKDAVAATRISRALVEEGIAVLRFDFTGLGGSGGDFAHTDFSSNIQDLVAAGEWLAAQGHAPSVLVGHSLGGAAVLAAVRQLPSVRAVVTVGAPSGPEHVLRLIPDAQQQAIRSSGAAEVRLGGRPFRISSGFVDDIAEQPQADRIRTLGAALLVLHAPGDETVGIDDARKIFDTARHPKSFVALDGADHLLTDRRDAAYAASLIALWARRHAIDDVEPAEDASPSLPPGSVSVVSDGPGLGQSVRMGRHTFRADEPRPMGSDDGPAPYNLLLAGLGTCTSMTLQLYARRKGWDLQGVEVQLRHTRARVAGGAADQVGVGAVTGSEVIDRRLKLAGALDDTQRARLLEIADRCPVHRTIAGAVEVRTKLS